MEIGELYTFHKRQQLRFNTEYQRTEVWPRNKKRLLIDSILRKYDISMIFLRQQINDNLVVHECIDGQQRTEMVLRMKLVIL
jgi:uncharacterized protein with ParB-like and HNH nuclease domain